MGLFLAKKNLGHFMTGYVFISKRLKKPEVQGVKKLSKICCGDKQQKVAKTDSAFSFIHPSETERVI